MGHGNHGNELFVCFTSRPSSASIKLAPSSSIRASSSWMMSPGRTDRIGENPASRRLKASGSIKGKSSPMVFAVGKKRNGSSFESQEPTSPKVTCIGQVIVKTKQGKKMMRLGRGHGLGGELSFSKREHQQHRDFLPHRNQRWGHVFGFKKETSFSICEAIREFTCFLPCTSNNGGDGKASSESLAATRKDEIKEKDGVSTACGTALAKWLMVWLNVDEKRTREEVVPVAVGTGVRRETVVEVDEDNDDRMDEEIGENWLRVEQLESRDTEVSSNDAEKKYDEDEEDKVIVPPRNALLLMRCRSDPVRMAALASRFWDSPVAETRPKHEEEDEDDGTDEDDEEYEDEGQSVRGDVEQVAAMGKEEGAGAETEITDNQKDNNGFSDVDQPHKAEEEEETKENSMRQKREEKEKEDGEYSEDEEVEFLEGQVTMMIKEAYELNGIVYEMPFAIVNNRNLTDIYMSPPDTKDGDEMVAKEEEDQTELKAEKVEQRGKIQQQCDATNTEESNQGANQESHQHLDIDQPFEIISLEVEDQGRKEVSLTDADTIASQSRQKEGQSMILVKDRFVGEKKEEEDEEGEKPLPDCLLLMMYEPKLSMEISKETWVCSRDFLWHRPKRPERKKQPGKEREEEKEENDYKVKGEIRRVSTDERPHKRSPATAELIEQKLVNAYEPFALTRCKSAPLRSTSMSVMPEACFWEAGKLHRPYLGMGF